jgi:hypothetical protein
MEGRGGEERWSEGGGGEEWRGDEGEEGRAGGER